MPAVTMRRSQLKISAIDYFLYDSKIITGSNNGEIKLWDSKSGNLDFVFDSHDKAINSLSVSNNKKLIISGSDDKTAIVWELRDNEN